LSVVGCRLSVFVAASLALLGYGFNDLEEGTTPEEYAEAVAEFEAETS
jgi:hypothetical protein